MSVSQSVEIAVNFRLAAAAAAAAAAFFSLLAALSDITFTGFANLLHVLNCPLGDDASLEVVPDFSGSTGHPLPLIATIFGSGELRTPRTLRNTEKVFVSFLSFFFTNAGTSSLNIAPTAAWLGLLHQHLLSISSSSFITHRLCVLV